MDAQPEVNESETRLAPEVLLPLTAPGLSGTEWMGRLEWGPGHMQNDMAPATVVVTEEDLAREATAIIVHRAIERAIERGEEPDYDG